MIAAVFPGQGSQHTGMGRFLYDNFKPVQYLFEEASEAIKIDFKKLCFDGAESDLALTHNTQPCLLLVSTASFLALKELIDFKPKVGAGHSVGEYAAVVTSGAIKFSDGLNAVRIRGEAMQSAVPIGAGGMTAVMGLDQEQVIKLCKWAESKSGSSPIEPANFNAPGQIVISGKKTLLDWLTENYDPTIFGAETPRTKFIPLKVSAPFHCSMMKPAEEKMATVLSEINFQDAEYSIVQNVSAETVKSAHLLRENLVKQISSPVRWIECVQTMTNMGTTRFIEVGCGRVLSGLIKKISGTTVYSMNSLEDLKLIETQARGHHDVAT